MVRRALIAATAALMLTPAAGAQGLKLENTTYVGLQGIFTKADTSAAANLDDKGLGLGAVIGWRAHRFVGLEIGYEQWGSSLDLGHGFTHDNTVRTFSGDIYGYYPIPHYEWLQPFLTVGLGHSSSHARAAHEWDEPVLNTDGTPKLDASKNPVTEHRRDITPIFSDSNAHLRAGAGVELSMGYHFASRLTVRYQPYKMSGIDNGISVSMTLMARI